MHKLSGIIAVSILSSAVAVAVHAQGQPQWALITTGEDGDRIFFDLASQIRQFDAGIKTNAFRTITTSAEGKSLRAARYRVDCFKGTLALQGLQVLNAQGSVIRQLPLDSADKAPTVPTKGTVAAEIWRYACSQF